MDVDFDDYFDVMRFFGVNKGLFMHAVLKRSRLYLSTFTSRAIFYCCLSLTFYFFTIIRCHAKDLLLWLSIVLTLFSRPALMIALPMCFMA